MKIDTVTKDFIKDNRIFADLFNQYIYGGRQVLLPEQLEERDSTEISLPYGDDETAVPVQKFRDVKKLYTAKTDGKTNYVLYGAELQNKIHYAMPVRNSLYDALAYTEQAEEAAKSYRRARKKAREKRKMELEQVHTGQAENFHNGEEMARTPEILYPGATEKAFHSRKETAQTLEEGSCNKEIAAAVEEKIKLTSEEFLSGFRKEDRLIPVVTLTIWWGTGEWDGPLSLFDMMDETDPKILARMNNYQVNLAAPGMMTDEEIMQYQTDLREVMLFIKYSKDREKLLEIMEENKERFEKLEKRAADIIEAVTGSGLKYEEGDETVNMCKAIQEIRRDAYNEGKLDGKLEGEQNERNNTLREKERADAAEQELIRLREENRILRGRLAMGN